MNNENALIEVKKLNIETLFTDDGIGKVLTEIQKKATDFEVDISTEVGRKEIASMAFKVARSKTFLDDLGKKRMEDAKKVVDETNEFRKLVRDSCDYLKAEVRKPLDDWEAEEKRIKDAKIKAEEERVQKIRDWIDSIRLRVMDTVEKSSVEILTIIDEVKSTPLTEDVFMEFLNEAKQVYIETVESLTKSYNNRLAFEEEQARQKEETERLAKIEAEQKAEAERLAEEQRKIDEAKVKVEAEKQAIDDQKRKERESKEKAEAEAREAERKKKEEEERKARQELLKPDKNKARDYLVALENIKPPVVKSEDVSGFLATFKAKLDSMIGASYLNLNKL